MIKGLQTNKPFNLLGEKKKKHFKTLDYKTPTKCVSQLAHSPGVFSPVGLEEVLVSLLRQERHQFIIGPAGELFR